MSIALGILYFDVPLMILFTVVFSVAASVGGFVWTIFARAIITDVTFWKFSNDPPNSASVPDAMTFIIMLHYTCTRPFTRDIACIGILDFGPRKKYPPSLIRASGSDM